MMLKFGRIVDLDRLEGLHINKTAEDLRMKIEAVERRRAQTVLDMEVQSRGWGLGNRTVILPFLPTYSWWYCCSVLFSHTYVLVDHCVLAVAMVTHTYFLYCHGEPYIHRYVRTMFASDYFAKFTNDVNMYLTVRRMCTCVCVCGCPALSLCSIPTSVLPGQH